MHVQQGMFTAAKCVDVSTPRSYRRAVANIGVCQLLVLAVSAFMETQWKLQCYKLYQTGLTGLAKG